MTKPWAESQEYWARWALRMGNQIGSMSGIAHAICREQRKAAELGLPGQGAYDRECHTDCMQWQSQKQPLVQALLPISTRFCPCRPRGGGGGVCVYVCVCGWARAGAERQDRKDLQ